MHACMHAPNHEHGPATTAPDLPMCRSKLAHQGMHLQAPVTGCKLGIVMQATRKNKVKASLLFLLLLAMVFTVQACAP